MSQAEVELAVRALVRAASDVEAAIQSARESGDRRRIYARVITFARLLTSNPVVQAALADIASNDSDARQVELTDQALLAAARTEVYELSDLHRDGRTYFSDAIGKLPPAITHDPLGQRLVRLIRGAASPVGRLAFDLSIDEVARLEQIVDGLQQAVRGNRLVDSMRLVQSHLSNLHEVVVRARKSRDLAVIAGLGSLNNRVDRMRAYVNSWQTALSGSATANNGADVPQTNGIEYDATSIASQVQMWLDGRRTRRLVLRRAKVFFEHFVWRELQVELAADDEQQRSAKEDLLQRYFDRFVFQEGYFPICQAEASRGRLDTLLADARRAGIPPLVIEFKQVVRMPGESVVSAREIGTVIDKARGEVGRYRGHLSANEGWEAVEPFVLVFHSCSEDVGSLQADDVVLIDLSKAVPSRVRSPR